jgi:hypothetical protein
VLHNFHLRVSHLVGLSARAKCTAKRAPTQQVVGASANTAENTRLPVLTPWPPAQLSCTQTLTLHATEALRTHPSNTTSKRELLLKRCLSHNNQTRHLLPQSYSKTAAAQTAPHEPKVRVPHKKRLDRSGCGYRAGTSPVAPNTRPGRQLKGETLKMCAHTASCRGTQRELVTATECLNDKIPCPRFPARPDP